MDRRQIIAMGGGGFSEEPDNPLLDDFVFSQSGAERPRILFLPTAMGDHPGLLLKFYAAMGPRSCVPSHLPMFVRGRQDVREQILGQDIIYVGGGNSANLLAIWRAHGIDLILREAWERGILIAGLCAGAMCWFERGITASFGGDHLVPFDDGLGMLAGAFCPHYDSDPRRAPALQAAVAEGAMDGYGVEDGAALHFRGLDLVEAVSSRESAAAHRVSLDPTGGVLETRLETRYLDVSPPGQSGIGPSFPW
ncbi:peptidase E [Miltoncostaea oceani]|uniref:Type 1 glutamine amidotransferase-like domain-containing protein n=1 Tax=Miltoncostaea oceani TaxID=2843216 RepID=UPI001C3CA839|nr:peptidase E [Miltoncostaea oceani]